MSQRRTQTRDFMTRGLNLETGRVAPAQRGCSPRDEPGPARPLSPTWDLDSRKGGGLFLSPPPSPLYFVF